MRQALQATAAASSMSVTGAGPRWPGRVIPAGVIPGSVIPGSVIPGSMIPGSVIPARTSSSRR